MVNSLLWLLSCLFSSAAGQFWAHGLKPMVVGLCKERAKALLCWKMEKVRSKKNNNRPTAKKNPLE
ncbi:hypothetical protein SGRA_0046 [Saprospira grandis str. Lewin]|uniref:Secreted protein n=1 Tax=Saprospira grandis (strain Lewin) TaxID=984262 RepID=H6L4B2_SAPGL|nr:hypothetical protein SGRA_0046 [Saprospira grandis str. Lewin]